MNKRVTKSPIEEAVMSKIQTQQVKMKPHYYYTLLGLLGISFVLLAGFVMAYAMSVLSLWLRIQSIDRPAYGARMNLSNMINDFPWWALIIAVVLLVLGIIVIRKIGSLYKVRLAYLIPAVIAIALIAGVTFSYTSLPDTFKNHSPRNSCTANENCVTPGQGRMYGRQLK
jgi:hypothetical protein